MLFDKQIKTTIITRKIEVPFSSMREQTKYSLPTGSTLISDYADKIKNVWVLKVETFISHIIVDNSIVEY